MLQLCDQRELWVLMKYLFFRTEINECLETDYVLLVV